jgi:hypothetical protein
MTTKGLVRHFQNYIRTSMDRRATGQTGSKLLKWPKSPNHRLLYWPARHGWPLRSMRGGDRSILLNCDKLMPQFVVSLAVLAIVATFTWSARAATHTIENRTLSVTFDDVTGSFSCVEKATGLVFLNRGRLDGATAVAVAEAADDSVFGAGRRIVIRTDRGIRSLELYEDMPFLLVRGELHNGGKEAVDVSQVVPATFTLDLGKPASELRTMGTAGLTSPDKNPGSYLFLTLADPATRRGAVAGWLTVDRGSGVLFSDVNDGTVTFRARTDYGHLQIPGGKSTAFETLVVGIFDDARIGEETYADAIAKHYRIKLPPQPIGYCTWYSDLGGNADPKQKPGSGASNEKDIVALAEFVARELKPFGFSLVQIDHGWQDGAEYNGPQRGFSRANPNGPYPHGIQPVAERFQQLGLTAGLWFIPFSGNYQDPQYKDRPHWFVKRRTGEPFDIPWYGTSFDLTQPEVKSYLASLAKTIHSWGVNYVKLDSLYTGIAVDTAEVNDGFKDDQFGSNAPLHDPAMTNIEAYRDGLRLLREAAGPEVFFAGCAASQNMRCLGGSIGLVDSMRIGPDNAPNWNDYRKEIENNERNSLVTGPARGSRLYFLHGHTWWNDPDPCYVRASVQLHHARLNASWMALSGQFCLNSDWIPKLPAERLDILKRTMPHHGAVARPVDYFDSILPSMWLVTDTRQPVRRDVLGLFNWDGSDRSIACTAVKVGLDPEPSYYAFDFWGNSPLPSFHGEFHYDVPAQSCRVIAIRAAQGHPLLVSTSRHVSQGIVDVTDEKWNDSSHELTGASRVIGGDPYELRFAGWNDGGDWKLVSVAVSSDDAAAGVAIVSKPVVAGEDGWIRVAILSEQSRTVRWTLKCDRHPRGA